MNLFEPIKRFLTWVFGFKCASHGFVFGMKKSWFRNFEIRVQSQLYSCWVTEEVSNIISEMKERFVRLQTFGRTGISKLNVAIHIHCSTRAIGLGLASSWKSIRSSVSLMYLLSSSLDLSLSVTHRHSLLSLLHSSYPCITKYFFTLKNTRAWKRNSLMNLNL